MLISLHIDDFLVTSTARQFKWLVAKLEEQYGVKHSDAKLCLNIEISREPDGSVLLGQEGYVACTLAELDMADIKIRHTPMSGGAVEAVLSATNH